MPHMRKIREIIFSVCSMEELQLNFKPPSLDIFSLSYAVSFQGQVGDPVFNIDTNCQRIDMVSPLCPGDGSVVQGQTNH